MRSRRACLLAVQLVRPVVLPVVLIMVLSGASARADEPAMSPALQAAGALLRGGEPARARAAYRELAEAGDPLAQQALAVMLLQGIGGDADRSGAMYWLCRYAHDPAGGPDVVRALWYLAEYFRTGGGLPGQRYNEGVREAEDPVKAYFWFAVLAAQDRHYARVERSGVRLGQVGMAQVGRQLHENERQQVMRALERWSPADARGAGADCPDLPRL